MNRGFALALCTLAVPALHGQVPGYVTVPAAAPATQAGTAAIAPVFITFERKMMQTLADGTHINRTTHERFYRDSAGRTRLEFEMGNAGGSGRVPRWSVFVTDPVAGQTLSWMSGQGAQRLYTVNKDVRPAPPALPVNADAEPRSAPSAPLADSRVPSDTRPRTSRETLGTQDVQGAPCESTRFTTVYPVDSIGNDRAITVVREVCTSQEFGRPLREMTRDPRTGVRTLTVTSLTRASPDGALFAPPADYTERPPVQTAMPPPSGALFPRGLPDQP